MPSDPIYDVFLSHSSRDKPAVEELARKLTDAGLNPFLDKWHLVPGEPWQEGLEDALDERVRDTGYRVIPVLLPGSAMPENRFGFEVKTQSRLV